MQFEFKIYYATFGEYNIRNIIEDKSKVNLLENQLNIYVQDEIKGHLDKEMLNPFKGTKLTKRQIEYRTNIIKNEIDILMRLDHPSIVNIYDIIEDENTIALVLEYMEGG